MDTKGLSGAEALLRLLREMGVERIFASPGSEWSPVWEYLAKPYGAGDEIPVALVDMALEPINPSGVA